MRSASSPDLLDRSPQTSIAPWQASFSTPSKGSAQNPCCAASRCAQRAQGSQDSRAATTARMSPRLMSAAPLNTSQIELSSCSPILDQRLQLHGTLDTKTAISFIFPLASLIPIATIMFTCRTAPHLQNVHRSTGMCCLQVSLQFPIRMLQQSNRQEASISLINCLGKPISFNTVTIVCQLLCQRATHTCQHNYNGVVFMCPLFPQGSNERETLRQLVHFLP